MLKFSDEWLEVPELSDWLVKVSNDESRAYCRYCGIVLRAHKQELLHHGETPKHVKAVATGAPSHSGPITVQVISNDEDEEEDAGTGTEGTPKPKKRYSRGGHNTPSKYRKDWESVPELSNWVSQHPTDVTKAYCRFCDLQLRAHKHDLLIHGRSMKHQSRMENYTGSLEMDPFRDEIANKTEQNESEGMKVLGLADFPESFEESATLRLVDDGDEDWQPASTPKKPKVERPSPASRASAAPRLIQLSDVLVSIERGDFSKADLLRIVKAAVPKL